MTLVLGADGCRRGWCGVAIEVESDRHRVLEPSVYASFDDVLATAADVICVDIPIGLLERPGKRACDTEARRRLGRGRASSVFPPPSRRSLSFDEYREASDANIQITGRRLNKQSFNISPKVREVDDAMKAGLQERVREVHPELSFWALNGGVAMRHNKKTREGGEERRRLLRAVLPALGAAAALPEGLRGRCGLDDYVDALVCAWTAVCIARGDARSIPTEPETDERGLRIEMWFPG